MDCVLSLFREAYYLQEDRSLSDAQKARIYEVENEIEVAALKVGRGRPELQSSIATSVTECFQRSCRTRGWRVVAMKLLPEIWVAVPDFESTYEVSSYGRIRSIPRVVRQMSRNGNEYFRQMPSVILRGSITPGGYHPSPSIETAKCSRLRCTLR